MKLSNQTAFLLIALLSLTASGAPDDLNSESPVKVAAEPQKVVTLAAQDATDSTPLQGKWEGVEVGKEGDGACVLTVAGNAIHFQASQGEAWYKATFTLPTGTEPKQLVATITDCALPEMVGKTSTAIYKLEQGKLTLAGFKPGSDRIPTSFEFEPGIRSFVFSKAAESPK